MLPLSQSRQEVEVDEVVDEFDAPTRRHLQQVLTGLGTGFAARGLDVNASLAALRPFVKSSNVVFSDLADPETRLATFVRAFAATADELGAHPEDLAGVLRSGGKTLAALDRPQLGRSIELSPATLSAGTEAFGTLRPVLTRARAITDRIAPAAALLPSTAKRLTAVARTGAPALDRAKILSPLLEESFAQLRGLAADEPSVPALDQLAGVLPDLRTAVEYLAPYQTVCNYLAILDRNLASTPSEGNASGNWLRFAAILKPDEMLPSSGAGRQPALRPLSERGRSGPAARVRGGQRALPAGAAARQRARKPGHADRPDQPRAGQGGERAMSWRSYREKSRIPPALLGLLVILATVLAFYLAASKQIPFVGSGHEVKLDFASANQIAPNAPVRIAGVNVGKVKSIDAGPGPHGPGHGLARRRGAAASHRRDSADPPADLPRGRLLRRHPAGLAIGAGSARRRHGPRRPDLRSGPVRPGPDLAAGAGTREPAADPVRLQQGALEPGAARPSATRSRSSIRSSGRPRW